MASQPPMLPMGSFFGFPARDGVARATQTIPEQAWRAALDGDGQPRAGAQVAELTAWVPTPTNAPSPGPLHRPALPSAAGYSIEVAGPAAKRWADALAERHGYGDISHTPEVFGLGVPAGPGSHRPVSGLLASVSRYAVTPRPGRGEVESAGDDRDGSSGGCQEDAAD